jgi:hypothetical protein
VAAPNHTSLLELQVPARPLNTWSIIGREHFIDNRIFECCNYAPHQSIVDVCWDFETRSGIPVFDCKSYTSTIGAAVASMENAFVSSLQNLKPQHIGNYFHFLGKDLMVMKKEIFDIYTQGHSVLVMRSQARAGEHQEPWGMGSLGGQRQVG